MSFLLKEKLFSAERIADLSTLLKGAKPDFNEEEFQKGVFYSGWPDLELMSRMRHTTEIMAKQLPKGFEKALPYIIKAAESSNKMGKEGFHCLCFSEFIKCYGQNHFELSMEGLKRTTSSCSSEFAVRPFIEKWPEETFRHLINWSKDKNPHVRRLSSEGCRPLLPWGGVLKELKADPLSIIPVLEQLKEDSEKYVQKSVANNLNDISKNHPDLVIDLAEKWLKSGNENTKWIVKHGLRTLLKKGSSRALNLFGHHEIDVLLSRFSLSADEVKKGEKLTFSFKLISRELEMKPVRVEYAVDFLRANGSHGRKVFQVKTFKMAPKEEITLKKTHSFHEMTTRKYYEGEHKLTVLLNGKPYVEQMFILNF